MTENIANIIDIVIKGTGAFIMIRGFLLGVYHFINCFIIHKQHHRSKAIKNIRSQTGGYILLGLDFIIISDILLSLVHQDQNQIISLAIIVAIRIAISYFLEKELEDIRK